MQFGYWQSNNLVNTFVACFFNRIKIAIFAALTRRKLRQLHVAAFSKTQKGHHPTTQIISNIATQHLQTNRTTTVAVACGYLKASCAISLSTRMFFFQNAVHNITCETIQNNNNLGRPQMSQSIFLNQQKLSNLHKNRSSLV